MELEHLPERISQREEQIEHIKADMGIWVGMLTERRPRMALPSRMWLIEKRLIGLVHTLSDLVYERY